ncbi:uncharacterized protein LOC120678083 [Panicum virgatum]|uniref:uncharacterized protein LOC120678083 n=1 Tax=Panicum virgatum TaxID=38727 RepID=UPI0019D5A2C6|nr:uncharacterized protein LOC120678083 [Panicum virgatum]
MASPRHSSSSSDDAGDVALPPAPAAVVQQINIRSHIPITLGLKESNYSQWRCYFDSVLGKFGLAPHVFSPPPLDEHDAEWILNDHSVVNWLQTTVHTEVFNLIYQPRASAFTGDLSIDDYCGQLKHLADILRDLGHPVSEPSQVLNLLRGLNPRYRHLKPIVTSKSPPHTFASARSFLLLEELCDKHDDKVASGQAYAAGHGTSSNNSTNTGNGGNSRNRSQRDKHRGANNSGSNSGGAQGTRNAGASGGQPQSGSPQPLPWAAGYNPWTGLVQAWPMPFRTPGAGVLGLRPPFQPQQAMTAQHQLQLPAPTVPPSSAWDQQAVLSALSSVGGPQQQPPSSGDWFLDTGSTTHMSKNPSILSSSSPVSSSSYITTDNGREFDTIALRTLLADHGVLFRLSCPYTSQQNGKAERILCTLNDCARTLLVHSGADYTF